MLDVRGLSVAFRGVKAIDGLSLQVQPGEFVGVVGPNGAGKSTLVQAITGFAQPTAGTIMFNGCRLDGRAPEAISAMGVARTFQTSRVFPALTVADSVMVGTQRTLIGGGRTPRRFGALLEPLAALAGLPSYRAAAKEAQAWADHVLQLFGDRLWPRRPTAGMNPTESHELADLLHDLHGRFPAMGVVMIEHKLDIVRRLTSRAVVMGQGRTIVDATPDVAFGHPDVAAVYLGRVTGSPAAPTGEGHLHHAPPRPMPGDPASPAIELKNVDVFYGPVQALFGLSMTVGRGEAVAVLGGNASGKSTTIRTILRLVTPRAGHVELFGQKMQARSTAEVIDAGVASIPEGRRMFAELTVRDNLLMGAFARRHEPARRLTDDLDLTLAEFPQLASRLTQLAGTLSGGEQQMLAMARAWLRHPKILCIDEPSMGLSPMMVDRVYAILARWKSQGMTIVMVEQSANHALELVDRAYVLRSGTLVLEGTAAALRNDPAIQEAYLGAAGQAKAVMRQMEGTD